MKKRNTKNPLYGKKALPFKASLLLSIVWLLFVIGWFILFFNSFSLYSHIGVILLSMLGFLFLIVLVWIHWLKFFIPQIGWDFLKILGVRKQVILTLIIPFMILLLLSFYLIVFADSFSLLQNVAMMIISIISIIVSISLVWRTTHISPLDFINQPTNPYTSFQHDDEIWK